MLRSWPAAACTTIGLMITIPGVLLIGCNELPQDPFNKCAAFPINPPQPSAYVDVPRETLLGSGAGVESYPLIDVMNRIERALRFAGYSDKRYYCLVDRPNGRALGYVIGTRLEHVNQDGTPKPEGERWNTQPGYDSPLQALLGRFVMPAKGFYRLIFFIITNASVVPANKVPREQMEALFESGALTLPDEVFHKSFDNSSSVVLLVYEFEQTGDRPAQTILPGRHSGIEHMQRSGILAGFKSAEHGVLPDK